MREQNAIELFRPSRRTVRGATRFVARSGRHRSEFYNGRSATSALFPALPLPSIVKLNTTGI